MVIRLKMNLRPLGLECSTADRWQERSLRAFCRTSSRGLASGHPGESRGLPDLYLRHSGFLPSKLEHGSYPRFPSAQVRAQNTNACVHLDPPLSRITFVRSLNA